MNKEILRKLVKEELDKRLNESVDDSYSRILGVLREEARKLNDDDAFELHERLKGYFNRLFENVTESHKPGQEVLYAGKKYIVVDEDEYIIRLKDPKTGDVKKVNYAMFKQKSRTLNESPYPLIAKKKG